jgi:SAM-dependent methyltransferase
MMQSTMTSPPRFANLSRALRDEVIQYYEQTGKRLEGVEGIKTLDTNSTLAADRGRLLLRILADAGGGPVTGRRVLDLGAGFAAVSVYLAHIGAEVVAVDPNAGRLDVGLRVARRYRLPVAAVTAHADCLPLPDASFHVVVANNSLCYIVDPQVRRAALSEIFRVLMPRGWLVMRNPNRLSPIDPFTGLPLLATMPPALARQAARLAGRDRSHVRLMSPGGAARELTALGFSDAMRRPPPHKRAGWQFGRYHHVVARRPR